MNSREFPSGSAPLLSVWAINRKFGIRTHVKEVAPSLPKREKPGRTQEGSVPSGLPSPWLHKWGSLRHKSLKPPPPHGHLVLIYSLLFSQLPIWGRLVRETLNSVQGLILGHKYQWVPYFPLQIHWPWGIFQAPKPWLPFALLLSGPCEPQWPVLRAGSPQHTLTYGMTWQVTPQWHKATTVWSNSTQTPVPTNSKESGQAVEPWGSNNQKPESPEPGGGGWMASLRESQHWSAAGGGFKHRKQAFFLIVR